MEGAVADNVRAFLTIDERACDADRGIVRQEFRNAEQQVRAALEAFGFYSATSSSSLEFGEDCWTAKIEIVPGDPVTIRSLDIEIAGAARDDPSRRFPRPSRPQGSPSALR